MCSCHLEHLSFWSHSYFMKFLLPKKKNYNRFKSVFIGSVLKFIYLLVEMLPEHDSNTEN